MQNLNTILTNVANNDNLPTNQAGNKLEQKFARGLKADLVNALAEAFNSIASDSIQVLRTADGITLAVDTEAGFVSVVVNPTIKNLDYDPFDEAEAYARDLAEKEEKARAKAEAKARKIKADAKARAERKAKAEAKSE